MASFTDSITQFNPYVSQLPVDAMVKVGMYKQQQYDQGVQRIQSQIDSVAGMDIAKDSDKQYLQSKLSQLGSKLTAVAAGDFSNQQLVSSVAGMATQVGRDENVQNAVSSTAMYKKGLAEIDEARKKGKAHASNVWDFTQSANDYLSNRNVGERFTKRYTPYTEDYNKKALEAVKALHPKMQDIDIPYVIQNGQIQYGRLAEVMQNKKITEVSEGQIRDAVAAVLNENDYNQMALDGRYKFRGVDPSKLQELATNDYIAQKEFAIQQLEALGEQRKMNLGDPIKNKQIEDRIAYYQDMLGDPYEDKKGKLDIELQTNLEEAKNDPDAVKARIYKDGFLKQFASAFKWREESIKYEDSPFEKVKQWKATNALNWAKFNEEKKQFGLTYNLSLAELEEKKKANELKKIELYGDQELTDWTTLGNITDGTSAAKTYSDLIDGNAQKQEGIKKKMIDSGYTDSQVNKFISDYNKNPKNYTGPDKFIGLLKENAKIGNFNDALMKKSDAVMANAAAKMMKDPNFKDVAALMNETVTIPNSTYSPKESRWINTPLKINGKQLISDIQSGKFSLTSDKAPAGQVYFKWTDAQGKEQKFSTAKYNLPSQLKTLVKYYDEYKSEVGKKYNEDLAPLVQEFIPRIKGVPGKKEGGLAPAVALNLSALITSADYQEIAADSNTNLATASSYLNDENAKNTKVFVHNYGGNNYEIWLKNEKSPNVIQKLKVPREKIDRVFGPGYTNNFSDDAMRLKIGRGNTNINANPAQSTLQTKFGDMPNIQRMDVTADLDEDPSSPGTFVPMINVKGKNGRYTTFPISGKNKMQRLGYEQGITQINALTDDSLLALLKESYPSFDFSTLDIR
jgi:hypothetical protein